MFLDETRPVHDGAKAPYDMLIIDGGGMVTTSWSSHRDLATAEDRIQSGMYVFITTLASLAGAIKPGGEVICAWDGRDNRAFRRGIHPWYKFGRGSVINRDEVRTIMVGLYRLLKALGVSQAVKTGHEADDVVATIALRESTNKRVLVFSDDNDYRQLISGSVHLIRRSMNGIVLSPSQCDMLGISYGRRYLHAKALHGDAGDNIRGLYRIGEKKAYDLLDADPDFVEKMVEGNAPWGDIDDSLRRSYANAGRALTLPRPVTNVLHAREVFKRLGRTLTPEMIAAAEACEEDALEAARKEAVRCLKLVTMDTSVELVGNEMTPGEKDHAQIPRLMAAAGLGGETDLYSSMFKLADALRPGEGKAWRERVRTGSAITGPGNTTAAF